MNERKPQRDPETKAANLDPIALSLALWLGLMVGALGLQRMAGEAAAQQTIQKQSTQQSRTGRSTLTHPLAAWSR